MTRLKMKTFNKLKPAKDGVFVLFPLSDNPLCGAFIERES